MLEIGIDIEDISRFEKYNIKNDIEFLETVFTKKELEYCYSKRNPAKHLTARFCAKEAFIKAIYDFDDSINFNEIEILNKQTGKPYINLPERFRKFKVSVSLSHEKTKAAATVIISD